MSFGLITRRVLTVNREDIVTRQESFELEYLLLLTAQLKIKRS